MRTLAVVSPFPSDVDAVTGGVEGVTISLLRAIKRASDFEIHVFSPSKNSSPPEYCDGIGTIHRLARSPMPGVLDYWTFFRQRLHRAMYAVGPSIAHFQGAAGWSIGYKLPCIATIHGVLEKDLLFSKRALPQLRSKLTGAVEAFARRRLSDAIVISPYIKDELGDQLHGRKWFIENPIDDRFFEIERNCTEPVALYVGRISQRKNVLGLINAFKHVVNELPEAKLVLAGAPDPIEYRHECERAVRENGMERNVDFVGNLDRRQLTLRFAQASCLALLSFQETAPLVIEEAMAAGVPVVASNVCGHPYMISNDSTGYLVDPADAVAAGKRMVALLTDEKLNQRISAASRNTASTRFRADVVAEQTIEVYEQCLKRGLSSIREWH